MRQQGLALVTSEDFAGSTYSRTHDHQRLGSQLKAVYTAMLPGRWWTLAELTAMVPASEASISARIRDLRKEKFGGHTVERRPRGERKNGLFEYRLAVYEDVEDDT
jgi:hypothetical protein